MVLRNMTLIYFYRKGDFYVHNDFVQIIWEQGSLVFGS